MPHAFLLHLTPLSGKPRLEHPSLHTHGLFYRLLERIDATLSAQVHAAKRNPFTLSTRTRQDGALLRVTTLDDALFSPLLRVTFEGSLAGLELGRDTYRVARVLATPEGDADAGYLSWQNLSSAEPVGGLEFRFLTPTLFSTSQGKGRQYTPLPLPRLVFGSLLRAYQTFHPEPYDDNALAGLEEAFEREVVITRHSLRTEPYQAGKTSLTGFVGSASFRYLGRSPQVSRALGGLGRLAFFSGLGVKTGYGMGQVRLGRSQ